MNALRAQVRNGRIVVDEPTNLPDGTELLLVPVDQDGSDGLEDATSRLQEVGLIVVSSEAPLHIRGGRRVREASGFKFYEEPFVVAREPDGSFLGSIEGSDKVDKRYVGKTLGEVVDFVIDTYRHG